MIRRTIHQWRDWLLEYIGEDQYELIRQDNRTVFRTITAKNAMDAENDCQQIIQTTKEGGI
ncbi:MAG: hypothetical protein OEL83_09130 [Desulforhopalus sp.]|nr:hypothetical protein [Desulforhopalus sp.]